MNNINYISFEQASAQALLPILNNPKLRTHLMAHERFTLESAEAWMRDKRALNAQPGCRLRVIQQQQQCIGWCGIQKEGDHYELAAVLDDAHWGLGKHIFRDMLDWARDMGHTEVTIHFLHTRPTYRFLSRMAKQVSQSDIAGHRFTTYHLDLH